VVQLAIAASLAGKTIAHPSDEVIGAVRVSSRRRFHDGTAGLRLALAFATEPVAGGHNPPGER
jgi:hypothetical protein